PGDLAGGHEFLEKTAHDFAGARFWQAGSEMEIVRFGDGTDDFSDVVAKLDEEFRGFLEISLERDERGDGLAFQIIRAADNGGFRHGGVGDEHAFDFRRAEAVAGNIEHVIETTDDPE